jgi:integrase
MLEIAAVDFAAKSARQAAETRSKPASNGVESPLTAASLRAAVGSWPLKPSQRLPLNTAINHAEGLLSARREFLAGAPAWSCAGLNRVLWQGGAQVPGLSRDAFRNMVSCLRRILMLLGAHADSGHGRNKLSPEWDALYKALPTNEYRNGLIRFFRFLTLAGITPATITSNIMGDFDTWCRTEILLADPTGITRRTAANWEFARKTISGWPDVQLHRPGMREKYALPFSDAPASFNADVERFLGRARVDRAQNGRAGNPYTGLKERMAAARSATPAERKGRGRSLRARTERTLDTRRWQIQVAMTALAESGMPIKEITALGMLAFPIKNAIAILDWHSARHEKRLIERGAEINDESLRSAQLKGIGELLLQIGRYEAKLNDEDEAELAEWVSIVTPNAQSEMSEKNRNRLKALFEDRTYSWLLNLPDTLIQKAGKVEDNPLHAARLAMHAAAMEILLILPLRRMNLLQLRLDTNLRRLDGKRLVEEIYIPAGQVKNRVAIHWPVDPRSARLLETYIRRYRPLLAKEGNMFLFPGIGDSHRHEAEFSDRFSKRVALAIGAEFNCHLARHFSVVRYLRSNPGAYEIASLILGHKNPETTRRFYCGLETDAAARHVNKVLLEDRRATKILPIGPYYRPHRTRRRKAGDQ